MKLKLIGPRPGRLVFAMRPAASIILLGCLIACRREGETKSVSRGTEPGAKIGISSFAVTPLQTNCYLLWDQTTKEAAMIDPGGEPERLRASIEKDGLKLTAIVLTHGHFDHVGAVAELSRAFEAKLYHHPDLVELAAPGQGKALEGLESTLVRDGDSISVGGGRLLVVSTPGHAPGSISLYLDRGQSRGRQGWLFTGDLLFKDAVGRTDLPGGDRDDLLASINQRLARFGDDVIVLPGHGPETTLGRERKEDPFFGR